MTLVIFAFLIAPSQNPKLTVRRSSPRLGGLIHDRPMTYAELEQSAVRGEIKARRDQGAHN